MSPVRSRSGTLFLDEVANAPMAAQTQLLQFLQDRTVRPLGGPESGPLDVHIIAATNTDLRRAVRKGRFRADLYDRLGFITIDMPPLREMAEDIMEIARHLLTEYNGQQARRQEELRATGRGPGERGDMLSADDHAFLKRPAMEFGRGVEDVLRGHDWPGNVRELQGVVVKLAMFAPPERKIIEAESVARVLEVARPAAGGSGVLKRRLGGGFRLEDLLAEVERHYFRRAMRAAGGVKTRAAQLLGMDRHRLNRLAERDAGRE